MICTYLVYNHKTYCLLCRRWSVHKFIGICSYIHGFHWYAFDLMKAASLMMYMHCTCCIAVKCSKLYTYAKWNSFSYINVPLYAKVRVHCHNIFTTCSYVIRYQFSWSAAWTCSNAAVCMIEYSWYCTCMVAC